MLALGRILPNLLFSASERLSQVCIKGPYEIAARTTIRNHFPRPSERKRILVHGWKKRMATPAGRRIIMNRILKGRWVYSH